MFGSVPSGAFEGVLELASVPSVPTGLDGRFVGRHIAVAPALRERPAEVIMHPAGRLALAIGDTSLEFTRDGDAGDALSSVAIIGHRGLSLGKAPLMNTTVAFEHAYVFGCSGVEFDVAVPYEVKEGRKVARPDALRVLHPPEIRSEIMGDDSVSMNAALKAPSVSATLDLLSRTGIQLVYVDAKLRWLLPKRKDDAQRAISQMVTEGSDFTRRRPGAMVMIAAERSGPGETADMLERSLAASGDSQVVWALEFTRGSSVQRFKAYVDGSAQGARPAVLSWSLFRIKGPGQGLLGRFLRDLSSDEEQAFSKRPQASVFWTAGSQAQFRSAVSAARRFGGEAGLTRTAIITTHPHRLAFFLASER